MHTYFISDLHLTPERPNITKAFLQFLHHQAGSAERLYILGDLFEFWIGDDAASLVGAEPVLDAMKAISEKVECFFLAGNRDFLVRDSFTKLTGFKLLADETVVDLYGTKTLLLHGDSLCTDDIAHQQFRDQMMTNIAFCDQFLTLEIPQRLEQAKQARIQSNEHKSAISMEIMDVTEAAVTDAFTKYNVEQMIHGHTHRQNMHEYKGRTQNCVRYVLGDWGETNSVLLADKHGLKMANEAI